MKSMLTILLVAGWCAAGFGETAVRSRPMKARVVQPLYLKGEQAAYDCLEWELSELAKCDGSLDLIVLPEACDVQALMPDTETYGRVVARNHGRLMEACAATARRCKAVVFVNGVDTTPDGWVNATFSFDTSGKLVGKYAKQHLTPGEQRRFGRAATAYTREWNEPYVLEIDGVRYAFLTCYDFYFYESYAAIARMEPDVVIGCSHQRSDKLEVLEFINQFCAYNTAAYLVRASVSMGLDSPLGGSSMVVAPDGKILGNMKSSVGHLDVTFDPFAKYLKPAGFGNPPATHPAYVEKGRRPWKYRPGGSAIVPGFADAPADRPAPVEAGPSPAGNTLATLGAAAATGVREVVFDLEVRDGEIVTSDGVRFADILRKLSCHILMNVRTKGRWQEADRRRLSDVIRTYDAERHVRVKTEDVRDEIVCEGEYDGHLQGVATDGTSLYWSHTKTIVKTDLSGKILRQVRAPRHQGDLCYRDGTVYVAVNLGRFNTHGRADSWVFAYDAETLKETKRWPLPDVVHGAGGMTWANGKFYVVGGLPLDVEKNFVYEYTPDFKLVKRHELATGFTHMGIQTAAFEGGRFLFGIYGDTGNPVGTLECPPTLDSFVRRTGPGNVGMLKLNGDYWTGRVLKTSGQKGHRGRLVRSPGFPACEKVYAPTRTGKGEVRIFFEGRDRTGWTDAGYRFEPDGNAPLFAPRTRGLYVPAAKAAACQDVPAVAIGRGRGCQVNDLVRGVRRVAETGDLLAFHVPGTPETLGVDSESAEQVSAVVKESERLGVKVSGLAK